MNYISIENYIFRRTRYTCLILPLWGEGIKLNSTVRFQSSLLQVYIKHLSKPPSFPAVVLFISVWSDTFVRLLHLVLCFCFEAQALTKLPLERICHANGRVWSKRALHDGSAYLPPDRDHPCLKASEKKRIWQGRLSVNVGKKPRMNDSHKDAALCPCQHSEASNPIWAWRDINRAMLRGGGLAKPTAWPA